MNKMYVSPNGNAGYLRQPTYGNAETLSNHLTRKTIFESNNRTLRPQVKNKILRSMPEKALKNLLDSMKLVYLSRNEYIYQPDEDIHFLYFPETAVFSEFQILHDGKMTEVMMTGCEGMVGVAALFNSHPSPNLTQILQGGQSLRIDTKTLKRNLDESREVRESVFEYINLLINQISQRAVCNGFHSIEERLCSWLLMIQERTGNSFNLRITHEQIAMSLGVHRPSVSQITKVLRNQKIIDYERGSISILDRRKLELTACDCFTPIH